MPRLTEMRADETYSGANFTAEEIEFLLAIERYQRERRRRFPTWHEVLRVLKSLGYRKVAPPRSPRKYQIGTRPAKNFSPLPALRERGRG